MTTRGLRIERGAVRWPGLIVSSVLVVVIITSRSVLLTVHSLYPVVASTPTSVPASVSPVITELLPSASIHLATSILVPDDPLILLKIWRRSTCVK